MVITASSRLLGRCGSGDVGCRRRTWQRDGTRRPRGEARGDGHRAWALSRAARRCVVRRAIMRSSIWSTETREVGAGMHTREHDRLAGLGTERSAMIVRHACTPVAFCSVLASVATATRIASMSSCMGRPFRTERFRRSPRRAGRSGCREAGAARWCASLRRMRRRRGEAHRDFDVGARIRQARIGAFAVLAFPETLPSPPRLEVAREGVVQAACRRADVETLVRLGVADDVHAGLALQCAHPVGIRFAAITELAIRRRAAVARVACDQRAAGRRPRQGHARPGGEGGSGIDGARSRSAAP